MFKRKQRGTCRIHGDFDGQVCGFCAMGNRLKDLDRNALVQRIEELEAHGLCRCADEVRCDMRKLITACEPYLKDGETPAECIQRNRDDTGAVMKLLEKEKRKYEALVDGVKSAQSHTEETLRLLQWDKLGWDVPEEVIESLEKADSELRALIEHMEVSP